MEGKSLSLEDGKSSGSVHGGSALEGSVHGGSQLGRASVGRASVGRQSLGRAGQVDMRRASSAAGVSTTLSAADKVGARARMCVCVCACVVVVCATALFSKSPETGETGPPLAPPPPPPLARALPTCPP